MYSQNQKDYSLAIDLVRAVDLANPVDGSPRQRRIRQRYGSLCHDFPILLRNAGLAQTVAFYQAKASSDGGQAFTLVLNHAAATLGVESASALESRIASASMRQYREDSARIWDAWVYFKRLASSILNTEAGDEPDAMRGPDHA